MHKRKAGLLTLAAASVLLGACSSDITVPNYNNPTTSGVGSDPGSLQLLANGVVYSLGSAATGYISALGILGRESYSYPPTEGRNVTNYLQANPLDPAGFAGTNGSVWSNRYSNLRQIRNLEDAVATTNLTVAQKAAVTGFSKTIAGLELFYVIATHDTLGAPIELTAELNFVAPFVSREAAYDSVSARLDAGAADLQAASAAFPFTVNMQFTRIGGATVAPADFLRFNRAVAARVLAYRGSIGLPCGGSSCYQQALTALGASFLNASPADTAGMNVGVYTVYSTASGAVQNTLSPLTSGGVNIFAHPSILRDTTGRDAEGRSLYTVVNAARQADLRTAAKIRTLTPAATPPGAVGVTALSTPYGFSRYPAQTTPIPVIRNEELILLRAEANIGLGNFAAALADINTIRRVSGGAAVAPLATLGTASQAIDALLYERRLSLLFEGHRINDVRRFGRLNTLPLDKVATPVNNVRHFVQSVFPIPQAECLSRALTPALLPASCS